MINFDMRFHWEWKDERGKLRKTREKRCHSYVLALIDTLEASFKQAAEAGTTLDTGNTARAISNGSPVLGLDSAAGATLKGIVVGTGTDAVTIADYKLKTLIAHGGGANTLSYGAMAVGAAGTSGSSRRVTLSRTLTNNSGADITIHEVGIYAMCGAWYFCIEHQLNDKTIANGANATAVYTIGVTV